MPQEYNGPKDVKIGDWEKESVPATPEAEQIIAEETAKLHAEAEAAKAAAPKRAAGLETARTAVADAVIQGPFKTEHTVTTESGQTINIREFTSTQAAYDHYQQQLEALNQAGLGEKVMNWRQRGKERTVLRESLAALRAQLAKETAALKQHKKIV